MAKKTLYEQKQESVSDAKGKNDAGLRKREKKIVIEREDGSTSESENGPSAVQRSVRKDSESSGNQYYTCFTVNIHVGVIYKYS